MFEDDVNPTTGLPMIDESGIDVGGNPYGCDLSDNDDSFIQDDDPFASEW